MSHNYRGKNFSSGWGLEQQFVELSCRESQQLQPLGPERLHRGSSFQIRTIR